MNKSISLTILLFFIGIMVHAQSTFRISGTVYDKSTKEAVGQAGIRVLSAKDSSYIAGTSTLDNGKFSIPVKSGKYIVNVSFLGYKQSFVNANVSGKPVALGDIMLQDDGILLSEAVVTAKAAEIAIKGDTVEYNADSYKVQESAVVEDLLKKMPGAEVDDEGKITINGKEVKKILVDGKEFFSSDPKVASKNLPAQMIEKLQVLDRKSDMAQMTGFDDGEEETVINLTVKKGMKEGLFGNVSAGVGNDDRYGISGMANYMRNDNQFTLITGSNNTNNAGFTDNAGGTFRRSGGMNFGGRNGITKSTNGGLNFAITSSDKFKWGGNIRFGDSNNDVKSTKYTEYQMNNSIGGNQYTNNTGYGNSKSTNYGADLRFEWTPDSKTKIIFSPNIQFGENTSIEATQQLTTRENPNDSVNWGSTKNWSKGKTNSTSATLDISRQLGKEGRVLSFSLSGGFNNQKSDGTNWSETVYRKSANDSTALRDQLYNQKNNGNNWRAYVSYVEPLGRNNFLQLNYSIRKNYSESNRNSYLNDGNDQYNIVDTTSTKKLENNFINQEIALNFKAVRTKYNYTIGLALQPSNSKSTTITPERESEVSNNVLNFAPVIQFNYLWDKRHNLRIDYNGRTSQPTTTQLSDVKDESNPNNIITGNPNLKPSFSNRFRVRFQKFNPEKASAVMVFGGFNFTVNDIVNKQVQHDDGRKETTYTNINGNWNGNLRVIFNRPLRNKKFSINSMTFGNYSVSNSFVNDGKNIAKALNLQEHIGLQYRSELFDMGLRGNIRYSNMQNNLNENNNSNIYNYGGMFNTTWYLPFDLTIDTDINYTANSGMAEGYQLNQWVWNASVSKQIFKAKNGTIRFNIYDILNQNNNISYAQSNNSITQSMTNSLKSYFMFSFIYKFQIFKGGAKISDMNQGGAQYRGPGSHPSGGFRGRPPGM